jgi:adenylosuccinate lyase
MHSISPLDGRYKNSVEPLRDYFTEYALMKQRYILELKYLEFFLQTVKKEEQTFDKNFSESYYDSIKKIEKETNHDVKAVEYFIRTMVEEKYHNYIHFGLTSHDINNVSWIQNIKGANINVMLPELNCIKKNIYDFNSEWIDIPMLSHTHGQSASPTTLGKEFGVFGYRLAKQIDELQNLKYYAKFGGAVGNLNAHKSSIPHIYWPDEMTRFLSNIGIKRDLFTTQISNYDDLSKMLSIFQRINTILIDMCQDIWLYISMGYFKMRVVDKEVGSSTMPHKVNPIQFENAEGNLGLANSIIQHFQTKLPVSRLQRDLTDSTVMRNMGIIYGYMYQSYLSIQNGFSRLTPNKEIIESDLNNNYVVVAEAIQTHLKLDDNIKDSYEKLKGFCRNNSQLTREDLHMFIDTLCISDEKKNELKTITPQNYTGYTCKLKK